VEPPPVIVQRPRTGPTGSSAGVTLALKISQPLGHGGDLARFLEPLMIRPARHHMCCGRSKVPARDAVKTLRCGDLTGIHPPGMRAIRIARRDVENLVERWHNRVDPAA
jgi:hypothetical protein